MPPEHALPPPPGHGAGEKTGPGRCALSARASLLVLGASARAWATSVSRTGLVVRAADLFADREDADVVALADYLEAEYAKLSTQAVTAWKTIIPEVNAWRIYSLTKGELTIDQALYA